MPPAEHRALSNLEYHGEMDHLSNGRKDSFDRDPLLYYQEYVSFERRSTKTSKALTDGIILHIMALEPGKVADLIGVLPGSVLSSAGGRGTKACAKYMEEHPKDFHVTPKEYENLMGMALSVAANWDAREIMGACEFREWDIFWEDDNMIRRKALCDLLSVDNGIVCNLKTSRHPLDFHKSVSEYNYHRGAAWYIEAVEALTGSTPVHPYIVVGNQPPYHCKVWDLPPEAIEAGRRENKEILRRFKECVVTKVWSTPHARETVQLSPWFYERSLTYDECITNELIETVPTGGNRMEGPTRRDH